MKKTENPDEQTSAEDEFLSSGFLVRMRSVFARELAAAESDLAQASWKVGVPTKKAVRSSRMRRPRLSAWHLQMVALLMVGVVASAALLAPIYFGRQPNSAALLASGSPTGRLVASPSGPDLVNGDGIPTTWQGQPVLRGQAALEAARSSNDASPFLVGFWAGLEPLRFCANMAPPAVPLFSCSSTVDVGDAPGIVSTDLASALRTDALHISPGPVIVRVHTHDPALMNCPAPNTLACQHVMVGDAIVWSGAPETNPRPTSVGQAMAAFNVPEQPTNFAVCEGEYLPGVQVLPFMSAGSSGPEGIVAVFPSPEALATAMPDAAQLGESDTPPIGSPSCAHTGTDALRGTGTYSLDIHWLARGNVLVGVQYDTSIGPAHDPIVSKARVDLAALPAS